MAGLLLRALNGLRRAPTLSEKGLSDSSRGKIGGAMPVLSAQADHPVGDGEIRQALERMAASEAFRGSPQLISFLRYVVEATLRGQADRIKGYTIATEALGRTVDFDPQADPIVRVEATRLRRALNRYHASSAAPDDVRIDLPLGSYVPVFRRAVANVVLPLTPPHPLPAPPARRWLPDAPVLSWRHAATGAVMILVGAAGYATLDFFFDFTPSPPAIASPGMVQSPAPAELSRESTAFPLVFVGPFAASGDANAQVAADSLRAKLRDALARFDELNVASGAAPNIAPTRVSAGAPSNYGLTASVETGASGLSVTIRLTDMADNRIVFARTFERTRYGGGAGPTEDAIVREVATVLAQPYGIIHSRERTHQMMNSPAGDPRYRCLLESYEYWRTFEPGQHASARECLERVIDSEPSFAAAYTSLSELLLQEYRRNLNVRAGDAPPLDRALRAARRAVELKPGSARAYQALMDVSFLRGEYALTMAAGEKAVTLNPYNPNTLACYAARLLSLGEVEKGARILKEAVADIVVRPPWVDFYLFLAAYLVDDKNAAASYADQIMSDKFAVGFAARALAAAHRGDADGARQLLDRMIAIHPGWREDPRRELKKLFPSDLVSDRLARDLARAGLGVTN
jgi:tetratricopeptide (TPR) repeat protein